MNTSGLFDTICAPATSVGSGAVSIIRISGQQCFGIVDGLVRFVNGNAASSSGYRLKRGQFTDVDDVLVGIFRAPHSYTGEDSAEIYCHASSYIVSRILSDLCEAGCRPANPGEFTRRAFLNGKMDLAQAEAVADVIAAGTQAQHRVAMNQLRGGYSEELRGIRASLLELSALMELELDFSEEDVEFADRERLRSLLDDATGRCRTLAESFRMGNAVKNGVHVAIAGAPNSGKSTLLNALLHDDRAIVSDIPGTTRDTVEDTRVIGGVMFRFIDTAGLRESDDTIERLGIERSYDKIRKADIVVAMLDGSRCGAMVDSSCCGAMVTDSECDNPAAGNEVSVNAVTKAAGELVEELRSIVAEMDPDRQKLIVLLNKIDLLDSDSVRNTFVNSINNFVYSADYQNNVQYCTNGDVSGISEDSFNVKKEEHESNHPEILEISAKNGVGIDALEKCLVTASGFNHCPDILVTNERHAKALRDSADALGKVAAGLHSGIPTDLLAEDLRDAVSHLGTITGEISTNEILGEIFSRFCIGK